MSSCRASSAGACTLRETVRAEPEANVPSRASSAHAQYAPCHRFRVPIPVHVFTYARDRRGCVRCERPRSKAWVKANTRSTHRFRSAHSKVAQCVHGASLPPQCTIFHLHTRTDPRVTRGMLTHTRTQLRSLAPELGRLGHRHALYGFVASTLAMVCWRRTPPLPPNWGTLARAPGLRNGRWLMMSCARAGPTWSSTASLA